MKQYGTEPRNGRGSLLKLPAANHFPACGSNGGHHSNQDIGSSMLFRLRSCATLAADTQPRYQSLSLLGCIVLVIGTLAVGRKGLAADVVLSNGSQTIEVHIGPRFSDEEKSTAVAWLGRAVDAMSSVYGAWPKDRLIIELKRQASPQSPVPWGEVDRSAINKVLLVIDPGHGLQALIQDWTIYHELSHLFIPYQADGDIWFSEGLASYYQNILQARSGLLDETTMWEKLVGGFQRGAGERQWSSTTLHDLSANRRTNRAFMRIYWSGALYWLTADLQLRLESNNEMSLDRALRLLKDCCGERTMSAAGIAVQLDAMTGRQLFATLFHRYRESYGMPDYRPTLARLGITATTRDSKLSLMLENGTPGALIRKTIYRP